LKGANELSIPLKNRREAFNAVKPARINRKNNILAVMKNGDPNGMTAEEITDVLCKNGTIPSTDRNYVKPRLTEMRDDGIVKAVGRRRSPTTMRNTTVWKAVGA